VSKELFEIPIDWVWSTMDDIADVIGGGTPMTKDPTNFDGGTIPWLTPADLSGYTAKHIGHGKRNITKKGLNTSSARMMPAGSVLFTSRAPIGYVAIAINDICTNQGFKSFILKSNDIIPDYVYWWIKGNKNLAESYASGTTFLELSGAKAKQIPIPIAPLDQQKRIVTEIEKQFSRLDEAVANLKRVKANLKRYKTAVLKAAVEGCLVETEAELARRKGRSYETGTQLLKRILETRRRQWLACTDQRKAGRKSKGKYKEPAAPDTADLPELPEGWVWAKFEQVTERVTKGSSPNWQGFDYCDKGIPFVRSQNVGWGVTDLTDIAFLSPAFNEVEKKSVLREGDVLLNIVGASIGRAAIAPNTVDGGNVNQAVAVIRLLGFGVSNHFVLLYLLSAQTQRRIHSEKVDVARANYSLEDIREMPLALPPEGEQQRIADEVDRRLSLVCEIETQVDANLQRAERLRQSILKKAFSGQLAANSEPDTEVAILLKGMGT